MDGPFRVLLLVIAVVGLAPASFEVSEPLYCTFQLIASLLLVLVCFVPVVAGAAGLILYIVFTLVYPDFVNSYQIVSEATVAFLLSQLRIRLAALFSILHFGVVLPSSLGLWGTEGDLLLTGVFAWLLAVIFGLVAAGFEKRIQAEVARREAVARAHERNLERVRLDMALDTHDIVSHGLAASSAIIRVLGIEARLDERADSKLTELALVNAHTQQQLRVLLSRLTDHPDGYSDADDFEDEMLRAGEMIRSATEAGGYSIDVRIASLPKHVPRETWEMALFVLKELATNIVKHASAPTPCTITVTSQQRGEHVWLHFESSNPVLMRPERTPRSLAARLERAGGVVTVSFENAHLKVQAVVPSEADAPM